MQEIVCLVTVFLVSVLVGVDSLQCYACPNCATPTEADLMTCGDPWTTMAPPGTTVAPPQTTVAPPQTTVAPPQTTVNPPQTTVNPPQTTVAPPQTTVAPPQTNVAPLQTAPAPVHAGPQGHKFKRSVLSPITKSNSDGCNCKHEAGCECGDNVLANLVSHYADEVQYVCFKVTAKVNDTSVVIRGCAPAVIDGKAPCDTAMAANTESCITCSTDKCNGGFTIQYSLFMLSATIGLMLFK